MSSMLAWAQGNCSRIRTFNGEHLSRGWSVFLIVRMSLKRVGIMATICGGGTYTVRSGIKKKKKKKREKEREVARARYHTLSVRFLRTRLQQKIALPNADRAVIVITQIARLSSCTRLKSPTGRPDRRAISLPDSPAV